jgi:hypothetical protein
MVSDVRETVNYEAEEISRERLTPERTLTQQRREEETYVTMEALDTLGSLFRFAWASAYEGTSAHTRC